MGNSRPIWFAAIAVVLALGGAAYYLVVAQPIQPLEAVRVSAEPANESRDEHTNSAVELESPREVVAGETRVETTPVGPEPAAPHGSSRLRVVDARTRKPIAGAEVRVLELKASVPQPQQGNFVELVAQALAKGKHQRSASDGTAPLPPKRKTVMVVAWTKERWGAQRFPSAPGVNDFALHLDGPIEVQTRDADGRPIANVPLALAEHVNAEKGLARRADATTDERGRAVFEHGRALLERSPGAPLTVVVDGSFPSLVERNVSLDDLGSPISITVPAFGSIEVIVHDFDDHEVRDELLVTRSPRGLELPFVFPEERPPTLQKGRVVFPVVAVGVAVDFETYLHPGKAAIGPLRGTATVARAGERVELVLGGSKSVPILVARVVDEDATPLARVTLQLQVMQPPPDVRVVGALETDDAGRFRLPLPNWPNGGGALRLVLLPAGERPLLTAVFDVPVALVKGEQTLPDIVLHGLPFIAAGRVVDQLGAPIDKARVEVLERAKDGSKWLATNGAAVTDADGVFTISAELVDAELGIRASANDAPPMEIAPLVRGSRGLELALERWASFDGSAWIDPGLSPAEVNVVWITTSPKDGGTVTFRMNGASRPAAKGEALAYFTGQRLQAGTGRLEFRAISTVILTLDPIELRPGRNDDLVRRLDLRSLIRVFNLTINDQRGESIGSGQIHFRPSGSEEAWDLWEFKGGHARILALAPELDLSVFGAPGRATFFQQVRGDRTLVLDGPIWTKISIEGGNPVRAPDTLSLVVGLKEPSGPTVVPALRNTHTVLLDEAGQASMAFACPGKYAVSFSVGLGARGLVGSVAKEVELQVDVRDGEQELTVAAPRVAIQRVLEELANAPPETKR